LILFAVMLTPNLMEGPAQLNRQSSLALAVALSVFGLLATLGFGTTWQTRLAAVPPVGGVVVATPGPEAPVPVAEQPKDIPYARVTTGEDGQVQQVLPDPTMMLGKSFVSDQLLAFEVISVILLVALMGAIIIARD